jgi:hypothetical protein
MLAAMTTLTLALVDRGWRLERASRQAVASEEAWAVRFGEIGRAIDDLTAHDAYMGAPRGSRGAFKGAGENAWPLRWRRLHPMVGVIDVPAVEGTTRVPSTGGHRQVVWVSPPRWPLRWDPVEGVRVTSADSAWSERVAQLPHRFSPPASWEPDGDRWGRVRVSPSAAPARLRQSGVLIVDGPLRLSGRWEVTGLLLLLGPLTVEGGALTVRGGVVGDGPIPLPAPGGVMLIPDREAVERALALVGRPTRAPFHLGQNLP